MVTSEADRAIADREAVLRLARGHGLFYVITGVWPLVSMRSFELVTGPKTDRWLVKTVGILVAVTGGTLLLSALRGRVPKEVRFLAGASAAGLAGIDVVYALSGRISKVYLLDAAVELGLAAAWAGVRER